MRVRPQPQLLCFAVLFATITTAQAGSAEIGDNINARIARAKSEQAARAAERASSKLADDEPSASGAKTLGDGCTIAIGNVFEDDKKIGTSARRETTVIVTGDIIQAGNNCR